MWSLAVSSDSTSSPNSRNQRFSLRSWFHGRPISVLIARSVPLPGAWATIPASCSKVCRWSLLRALQVFHMLRMCTVQASAYCLCYSTEFSTGASSEFSGPAFVDETLDEVTRWKTWGFPRLLLLSSKRPSVTLDDTRWCIKRSATSPLSWDEEEAKISATFDERVTGLPVIAVAAEFGLCGQLCTCCPNWDSGIVVWQPLRESSWKSQCTVQFAMILCKTFGGVQRLFSFISSLHCGHVKLLLSHV